MNLKYTQKEQWYNFANIFFIIILINQSANQVGVYFNILLLFWHKVWGTDVFCGIGGNFILKILWL